MRKTMMFLVAGIFLMSSVCFGAKVDPAKIVVPRDSGRIVETYVSPNADAPVIAYVQDIHANYEAQRSQADILEILIKDYGFDLLFLEGKPAGTTADLKFLRDKYGAEVRDQGSDKLLKDGTISAINYVDITTDLKFSVYGVEDMNLYKKEKEDHFSIFEKNSDIKNLLDVLKNIAGNLKLHMYTKELRDLDDKVAAYDKDEIGLVEYTKFLQSQATANNIDVKALPNLALFVESADLEGKIDFPAVETERKTAADAIEKALADKAKEEFTAKNLQFRTGEISQGAFYAYLKTAAEAANVDLAPHKNLTAYTQYITTYEKIDTGLLFKEIDQFVEKIREAQTKTPEQKKLSEISKGLEILSGFANTKLVPDEYNFYVQNKASFDLDGWLVFIKENSTKFGLTNPVPDAIDLLKTNLPLLERFYGISFERDQAFIKNIKEGMANLAKDRAIFVSGGFHSQNVKKLLKDNGLSYVLIAPRVDIVRDYDAIYKQRAHADMNWLKANVSASNPVSNLKEIDAAVAPTGVDVALAKINDQIQASAAPNLPGLQQAYATAKASGDLDGIKKAASDIANLVLKPQGGANQIGNKVDFAAGVMPSLADIPNETDRVMTTIKGTIKATGQQENIQIAGTRITRQDFIPDQLIAAIRNVSPKGAALADILETTLKGFNGQFVIWDANQRGMFGFESPTGNLIAVSAAVADNPVAGLHEVLHRTIRDNENARNALLAAAPGAKAEFDKEVQARGVTAPEDLDHYAIRAFTANCQAQVTDPATGQTTTIAALDARLSDTITQASIVHQGAGVVMDGYRAQPKQDVVVIAPSQLNAANQPVVQQLRNAGANVTFADAATPGMVEAAIKSAPKGARILIFGLDTVIDQVNPGLLAGRAVLKVGDLKNLTPTIGDTTERVRAAGNLVIEALLQIDGAISQTGATRASIERSLQTVMSALQNGQSIALSDIQALIPLANEDGARAKNRIGIGIARILPAPTCQSSIAEQMVSFSITASAA